jgi:AefR-like transcriptional repressor, C-terminal domain
MAVTISCDRFPDLVAEIHSHTKLRLENAVINYLRSEISRGALSVSDPARAASLFVQMVCAELRDCLCSGQSEEIPQFAHKTRLDLVVEIFLNGVARHNDVPVGT